MSTCFTTAPSPSALSPAGCTTVWPVPAGPRPPPREWCTRAGTSSRCASCRTSWLGSAAAAAAAPQLRRTGCHRPTPRVFRRKARRAVATTAAPRGGYRAAARSTPSTPTSWWTPRHTRRCCRSAVARATSCSTARRAPTSQTRASCLSCPTWSSPSRSSRRSPSSWRRSTCKARRRRRSARAWGRLSGTMTRAVAPTARAGRRPSVAGRASKRRSSSTRHRPRSRRSLHAVAAEGCAPAASAMAAWCWGQ